MPKVLKGIAYLIGASVLCIALVLLFFNWQAGQRETRTAMEAAPAPGRLVEAADVQVFVQEAGPAEGEPVLLVHGTGAWSEIWRETLQALSKSGYRVIAMDVPPFGYSDKPVGMAEYSRQKQARRILGLLDSLGIKHAIFVGHSVGARPTLEAALERPGMVDRLVLVDPALGFQADRAAAPHFEQDAPSWLTRVIFGIPPLRNAILETYGTNPLSTKRLFSGFVSRKEAVTEARVSMLQQPLAVQGTSQGYGDWLGYLLTAQDDSLGSDFGNFRRLTMPVSLIWGEQDEVTPLWQGEALQQLIPQARLDVMPGVGHIPYIEDPERFDQLLLQDLSRH